MKRPIAMLLALLLTAGLFAFVSCGEAKNYTVKVNEKGNLQIFLNQSEIDRIYRELDEKGWSVTQLIGFDDKELYGQITGFGQSTFPSDTYQDIDSLPFIAKCTPVSERETWRIDFINKDKRYLAMLVNVYKLKIEKIYRTDGNEKEGDIIRFAYNVREIKNRKDAKSAVETGFRGDVNFDQREPTVPGDSYYIMQSSYGRNLTPHPYYKAVFDQFQNLTTWIIHQVDKNTYAMDSLFQNFINAGHAYPMPNEDKVDIEGTAVMDEKGVLRTIPYPSNYEYYVDIENFDELFQDYVNEYPYTE